jgi:hypothetical protein
LGARQQIRLQRSQVNTNLQELSATDEDRVAPFPVVREPVSKKDVRCGSRIAPNPDLDFVDATIGEDNVLNSSHTRLQLRSVMDQELLRLASLPRYGDAHVVPDIEASNLDAGDGEVVQEYCCRSLVLKEEGPKAELAPIGKDGVRYWQKTAW